MREPIRTNKTDAVQAVRKAAWTGEVETCGHPGCTDHRGPGTPRIHTMAGGIGADWNLDAAIDFVENADEVWWIPNPFDHDLLVTRRGRTVRFEARNPADMLEVDRGE